jgi:hypothetical protein
MRARRLYADVRADDDGRGMLFQKGMLLLLSVLVVLSVLVLTWAIDVGPITPTP